MAADGLEALRTDDMLNTAGVLRSDERVHAQRGQPVGEQGVPFIDALGNLASLPAQTDAAVFVQLNIAVLTQGFSSRC